MENCTNRYICLDEKGYPELYSSFQQSKDLIAIGAYVRGSDPQLDRAIGQMPAINRFLQQSMHEVVTYDDSLHSLSQLMPAAAKGPAL